MGQGVTGYTMFNTILTPNDHQYQFSGCRFNGMPDWNMDNGFVDGALSYHSGGVNVLFADGERALRQGRDQSDGVVVLGRRRGARSSPPIPCKDLSVRRLEERIMPWNLMNNGFVPGTCRCLILVGISVVAGCSWSAPVPADYVPDETPTEPWIIATPNPVPPAAGPARRS